MAKCCTEGYCNFTAQRQFSPALPCIKAQNNYDQIVQKSRQLTTSNHLGYFQSEGDSTDHLIINANGYETSLIKVPGQKSFAVGLKEIEEVWTIVEDPASPFWGRLHIGKKSTSKKSFKGQMKLTPKIFPMVYIILSCCKIIDK